MMKKRSYYKDHQEEEEDQVSEQKEIEYEEKPSEDVDRFKDI